jgi:drug/metabolite transporter (DMT)-like permease
VGPSPRTIFNLRTRRAKKGRPGGFRDNMKIVHAILIKLVSVLLFAMMSALIRWLGASIPLGQVVFFRSLSTALPVLLLYALRGEIATALHTRRPFGHVTRGLISVAGMFLNFAALARLPLMDATAISFAAPLVTVALAALLLNERVHVYRWCAVAVGLVGVLVMLWPYLSLGHVVATGGAASTIGAMCAVGSCFTNAGSVIQTRRLTDSETTASIVFYFSLICTLAGGATLPFVWVTPTLLELAALVSIGLLGGLSHLMLTESYRYAPASVVAPFDYTSMFWAFLFGFWLFGEVPTVHVFIGAAIVAGSGLFVIVRERRRGIEGRVGVTQSPPGD